MLTFIGFLLGAGLVAYGIINGNGHKDIFLNWQGVAIVLGGTVASTFVSHPLGEVLRAFKSYFIIFRSGAHDYVKAIDEMVASIRLTQRTGLNTAIERIKSGKKLWILHDGLEMMANGYSREETHSILEDQVRWQMSREMKQHELFGTMAKIAPAFGMLGTLIGLINMLTTLQSQPGQVGLGLAVALTTTFYGLALSSMIFGPISEKIRARAENNLLIETMQLETVVMVYEKRNYVYVRDKLAAYLNAGNRKKIGKSAGADPFPEVNKVRKAA